MCFHIDLRPFHLSRCLWSVTSSQLFRKVRASPKIAPDIFCAKQHAQHACFNDSTALSRPMGESEEVLPKATPRQAMRSRPEGRACSNPRNCEMTSGYSLATFLLLPVRGSTTTMFCLYLYIYIHIMHIYLYRSNDDD